LFPPPFLFLSLIDLPSTAERPLIWHSRWEWNSPIHRQFFLKLEKVRRREFAKCFGEGYVNQPGDINDTNDGHHLTESSLVIRLMEKEIGRGDLLTLACYVLKRLVFQQQTPSFHEHLIQKGANVFFFNFSSFFLSHLFLNRKWSYGSFGSAKTTYAFSFPFKRCLWCIGKLGA